MKRSVAIRGPTPMFVRWAIEYPCPFREIFPDRLPDTTFRQLRSIREVSLANREDRIRDGICLHPNASNEPVSSVLGFPVSEIVELHGGEDFISHTCRQCPAHSDRFDQLNLWAGCFGWLSADLRFDFESAIRGGSATPAEESLSHGVDSQMPYDLVRLIDCVLAESELDGSFMENFSDFQARWFALWHRSPLTHGQLLFMEHLIQCVRAKLNAILATHPTGDAELIPFSKDLNRFNQAVRTCREHHLPLHVELVPKGYSDGEHWRIRPHCRNCKFELFQTGRPCPACMSEGIYQNEIKLKVLGVRPYLNLSSVIGATATERLVRSKG